MISKPPLVRFALLSLLTLTACSRNKTEPKARDEATPTAPSTDVEPRVSLAPKRATYEGVEVIELFTQGADTSSPLVVAIHGRGDNPKHWVDSWSRFPAKVEVLLPRAFERFGEDGWSWFALSSSQTDAEYAASVGDAEKKLWPAILNARGDKPRKLIVTGFSQGGILSFAMAARHPNEIARAFPVSGGCPVALRPRGGQKAAPVFALHGDADRVLSIDGSRDAIKAFKDEGAEATLKEYGGVGHMITPEMNRDWWDAIVREVQR